jgi:hypothetical protein
MATSSGKYTLGRGEEVAFVAPGLLQFLREASQASPKFNLEMRKAAMVVANYVVDAAKSNAAGQPPHGKQREGSSGRSQAQVVVNGLRARHDRIPTIKLDSKRGYPSKSRTNKQRTAGIQGPFLGKKIPKPGTVTMGQVFFGAEFGGRRRKTTQQFLRHRGRQGYFFWQAVRDNKEKIAAEYISAVDLVLKKLAAGAS